MLSFTSLSVKHRLKDNSKLLKLDKLAILILDCSKGGC